MQNLEGLQLGKFKVSKLIGIGGFSVVYQVEDTRDKRTKIIKLLAKEWIEVPKVASSFIEESIIAQSLNHPNVIRVLESGKVYGQPYYLMDYWGEKNLYQWVNKSNFVPNIHLVHNILTQLAEGLDYIHSQGYVHRDVKPQNIQISEDNKIKILDFGLVERIIGSRLRVIGVSGTKRYMAPEQYTGRKLDVTIDSYAFGVISSELLKKTEIKIPEQSSELLGMALSKNPHKRPSNLERFVITLFKPLIGNG